jgi:hypothetical protein
VGHTSALISESPTTSPPMTVIDSQKPSSLAKRVNSYGVRLNELVTVPEGTEHRMTVEMKGKTFSIDLLFKGTVNGKKVETPKS